MHIFCFAPTGSGCPSRAARQLNTQNRLVTVSPWVFAYLITARLKLLLPVRTIATATIVTAATAAPATTAIAYRPCLRAPAPRFRRASYHAVTPILYWRSRTSSGSASPCATWCPPLCRCLPGRVEPRPRRTLETRASLKYPAESKQGRGHGQWQ